MKIRAIFPGSFDPVHYGHIDIAARASRIFDSLVVAVYETPSKNLFFSTEERLEMLRQAMANLPNVEVVSYRGLTIGFAKQINAQVMVRGLRVFSDFDNEFRMALTNQELDPTIETISLITAHQHTFVSSTTVKEIAELDGDVSSIVPDFVAKRLKEKFASKKDEII
ncbi:MAG TPA: pantetheine-phosphate adenylyltransferase [Flexilinea sp.]|nr:pantetheine-phosphate adenylyltransferase [Flexilinea sp.]